MMYRLKCLPKLLPRYCCFAKEEFEKICELLQRLKHKQVNNKYIKDNVTEPPFHLFVLRFLGA